MGPTSIRSVKIFFTNWIPTYPWWTALPVCNHLTYLGQQSTWSWYLLRIQQPSRWALIINLAISIKSVCFVFVVVVVFFPLGSPWYTNICEVYFLILQLTFRQLILYTNYSITCVIYKFGLKQQLVRKTHDYL